ncbi:MAG: hypothetical protein Q7R39_16885 [Dehalococcoidia bacterium]|nr:hypothetical protein [Dehalococcoidia bacterium]
MACSVPEAGNPILAAAPNSWPLPAKCVQPPAVGAMAPRFSMMKKSEASPRYHGGFITSGGRGGAVAPTGPRWRAAKRAPNLGGAVAGSLAGTAI